MKYSVKLLGVTIDYPLVWHFCSKTSSAKMEKTPIQALRLVFNNFDSSYESLLERVNLPTLHISRN